MMNKVSVFSFPWHEICHNTQLQVILMIILPPSLVEGYILHIDCPTKQLSRLHPFFNINFSVIILYLAFILQGAKNISFLGLKWQTCPFATLYQLTFILS